MNKFAGRKSASVIFFFALVTLLIGGHAGWAQPPRLDPMANAELQNAYQDKKPYTVRLQYTDPSGDEVSKSKAIFVDEGPSGNVKKTAESVTGDPKTGAVIEWRVNGFEPGSHKGYFEVTRISGDKVRYPAEATDFYSFVVENLTTKWIILAVGASVALTAIPAIVFFLSRAMNPRGDSSQAARVGLLIGVLAFCVLFIALFLSVYGWLVFSILVVGILALPLLVTRRR